MITLLALSPFANAQSYTVLDDGDDLAGAISAAAPGATIWLAPGSYDVANVGIDKDLRIRALVPGTARVRNTGSGHSFDINAPVDVVFWGVWLDADGARGLRARGDAQLTLDGVRATDANSGERGGALRVSDNAIVDIVRSRFETSQSNSQGGHISAVNNSVLSITDSELLGGRADEGGSIQFSGSNLTLTRTIVRDSRAISHDNDRSGGGLYLNGGSATITQAWFENNEAERFGGDIASTRSMTIDDSVFCRSSSSTRAGAAVFWGPSNNNRSLQVTDSLFLNHFTNSSYGGGVFRVSTNENDTTATLSRISVVGTVGATAYAFVDYDNSAASFTTTNANFSYLSDTGFGLLVQREDRGTVGVSDSNLWASVNGTVGGAQLSNTTTVNPGFPAPPAGSCDPLSVIPTNGNPGAFTAQGLVDADGDGFLAPEDCDDDDDSRFPGAPELCDNIDNDCDRLVDEDLHAGGITLYVDRDGDGLGDPNFPVEVCGDVYDDSNPLVDNADDCDDADPELEPSVGSEWYRDVDGDGFGDPNDRATSCDGLQPDGYVDNPDDCDDTRDDVHPDAHEVCDGVDNTCNELIDDEDSALTDAPTWYVDGDGDGFGSDSDTLTQCAQPNGYTGNADDCDDSRDDVNPDADEVCDNVDNTCNGLVDDADPALIGAPTWYADLDSDGFGDPDNTTAQCVAPAQHTGAADLATDCDDTRDDVNPDADEVCDGVDNTCNDLVDDADPALTGAPTWYADLDGDGFGDPNNTTAQCVAPAQHSGDTLLATDCDDSRDDVNPDAEEVCDGVDNTCNDLVDDDDPDLVGAPLWYADSDSDGFGDPDVSLAACVMPSGYESNADDCDDSSDLIAPGAPDDQCDGLDNDCDGTPDSGAPTVSGFVDGDGDGYGDSGQPWSGACPGLMGITLASQGGDCDDGEPTTYPGAPEFCSTTPVDSNCNGLMGDDDPEIQTGTWYPDLDGDGFGDGDEPTQTCDTDGLVLAAGDCDDTDPDINPAQPDDDCDGVDDNCDGNIDEAAPLLDGYLDSDGDGFGETPWIGTCPDPADGDVVGVGGDCDDGNPHVYPGAPALCDGLDNDCDNVIDTPADQLFYPDLDGDGFGDGDGELHCPGQEPEGWVATGGDCDDGDAAINPDAVEVCGPVDNDCDGVVGDDDPDLMCDDEPEPPPPDALTLVEDNGCGCSTQRNASGLALLAPLLGLLLRRRRVA